MRGMDSGTAKAIKLKQKTFHGRLNETGPRMRAAPFYTLRASPLPLPAPHGIILMGGREGERAGAENTP